MAAGPSIDVPVAGGAAGPREAGSAAGHGHTFAEALMGAEAVAICGADAASEARSARTPVTATGAGTGTRGRAASAGPNPKLRQSEQGVHVHGPAGLTDLQHQHIGHDERV
jgi:hypothetical protein